MPLFEPEPGYVRLFRLTEADWRTALRVRPRELPGDPYQLLRAEIEVSAPVIFEFSSGRYPRDLVGSEFAPLNLVSDRVVALFTTEKFSGWKSYPVEVYGKDGNRVHGYHGLAARGRCGRLHSRTGRFDPDSWDGSHVFVARESGALFVSEPVKVALEALRVKNFRFEEWDRAPEPQRRSNPVVIDKGAA